MYHIFQAQHILKCQQQSLISLPLLFCELCVVCVVCCVCVCVVCVVCVVLCCVVLCVCCVVLCCVVLCCVVLCCVVLCCVEKQSIYTSNYCVLFYFQSVHSCIQSTQSLKLQHQFCLLLYTASILSTLAPIPYTPSSILYTTSG